MEEHSCAEGSLTSVQFVASRTIPTWTQSWKCTYIISAVDTFILFVFSQFQPSCCPSRFLYSLCSPFSSQENGFFIGVCFKLHGESAFVGQWRSWLPEALTFAARGPLRQLQTNCPPVSAFSKFLKLRLDC